MHKTIATTTEFLDNWDSRVNFLMADECLPFSFEFPPTKKIVERLVAEQKTTLLTLSLEKSSNKKLIRASILLLKDKMQPNVELGISSL